MSANQGSSVAAREWAKVENLLLARCLDVNEYVDDADIFNERIPPHAQAAERERKVDEGVQLLQRLRSIRNDHLLNPDQSGYLEHLDTRLCTGIRLFEVWVPPAGGQ